MKETDVVDYFKEVWKPYPLHPMINTAEPGWPDRFLQLSHSTVVAIEFKLLLANKSRAYRFIHFRKEQAAWFAKWQRFGGYCMLFCGVLDWKGEFVGYDIVTRTNWNDWIHLKDLNATIGERELVTTPQMIRTRMREWLQTKRLSQKSDDRPDTETLTQPVDSGSHSLQERVDA